MKTKILPGLVAALCVGAIQAQTVIDYEVAPGTGAKNNKDALIGQSFTANASASAVSSLDIYVNRSSFATADFTLSLYAVSGAAGDYVPAGNALFSRSYSNDILSGSDLTHYVFDNLNWTITGGTTYLVAFGSNPGQGSVRWDVATTSDSTSFISGYAGQNRYIEGSSIPTGLYAMTVTTSAVPEPAAYAILAGAAALGLALSRRRHSRR